jgi:hypothetical protein
MRRNDRSRQRGASVVEFTLSLIVLIPLLIGTLIFGFRLVRSQQMDQITRDLAHMYSRGPNVIDFTTLGATSNAQTLAGQFSLTSSGASVVIFSTIQIETAAACLSATGSSSCSNLNQPVFVQQIAIGNTSANSSAFGTPTSGGTLPATTGVANNYSTTVTANAQATNSWAVAKNFGNVLSLTSGEVAYMTEMYNNTTGLSVPGLTGAPQVYSRAIF